MARRLLVQVAAMKTDARPHSSTRRFLAACGFAACWLGAAVTGFQATVGDGPGGGRRVEQRAPSRIDTGDEPQTDAPEAPRTPGGDPRTAIREYWR
jgi:hypothetical protein